MTLCEMPVHLLEHFKDTSVAKWTANQCSSSLKCSLDILVKDRF